MTTQTDSSNDPVAIIALAGRHGLRLSGELEFNELGLDFRVATARDEAGTQWVLRLPRRADVLLKIEKEAKTLKFLKSRLPVAVPDWHIVTPELVAYPRLTDTTALSIQGANYALTWHIDQESMVFCSTLAQALVALHAIPVEEAMAAGFAYSSPAQARQIFLNDLERVKEEIGIGAELEHRWRTWLGDDSLWPSFSVPVHGDLYAGHILVDESERVSGIIDWTESEVSDPSIDFSGHFLGFGKTGLENLIAAYEKAGGRTWPQMAQHVEERCSASPVKYGLFVLESGQQDHLPAARSQLGLE